MIRLTLPVSAGIFIFLAIIGCSGNSSGLIPADNSTQKPFASSSNYSQTHTWGLWSVEIDTSNSEITIMPLRGPSFTANVNNLLESKPGNLIIKDLDLSGYSSQGLLNCTVTLKHPFPGLDKYHGFDVWGVFIHNAANGLFYEDLTYPGSPGAGDDEAILLNADGYTRWFNRYEFWDGPQIPLFGYHPGKLSNLPEPTATLNGYKIFADGLQHDEDFYEWIMNPSNSVNRGIFRAGSSNSRRYELKFPIIGGSPVLKFQYAVVANWEPGNPALTGDPSKYDPWDFPSSANCEEAFFVNAITGNSTLFNDGAGHSGGSFIAEIRIFDWQGGSVGLNGVLNEIQQIIIEAEFLPNSEVAFSKSEIASMALPHTENSSVVQVDISGCAPPKAGINEFFVIVEAAGLNAATYGQGFDSTYPNARRAAFYRGKVLVSTEAPLSHEVYSIKPDHVPFYSTDVAAEITGLLFEPGATVQLRKDGEPPVDAVYVSFVNSTKIVCDFNLAAVDSGVWDVVVINPGPKEAILKNAFTIDIWSEEKMISSSGCKLPRIAEIAKPDVILVTGNIDATLKYQLFTASSGVWAGPYLGVNQQPHDFLISVWPDPVTDHVYIYNIAGPYTVFRYPGGKDPFESTYNPIWGNRCAAATADIEGRIHIFNNTADAFGWVIHIRAPYWGYTGTWDISYILDSYNDKTLSEGNIIASNSAGTIFVVYEKDRALDPYFYQPGPRSVRICRVFLGQLAGNNFSVIEETNDKNLDSPAITCTPNNVIHTAYRRFVNSTSQWRIDYERSSDGIVFGSNSTIWSGTAEPEKGYVYLLNDSLGVLHCVYRVNKTFYYKNSSNGSTWSSEEIVDPGVSGLPSGIEDITPNAIVTNDDVLHVVWTRGNPSTKYGAVIHRMRDLN